MEQMRSLLLVSPLDSDMLKRAFESNADCIVLDLVGCSMDSCKGKGINCMSLKDSIAASTAEIGSSKLYVRVSHPQTLRTEKELLCIMSVQPEGVILPCATGHEDVACLSAMLSVIEAQYDVEDGTTRIIAISGETSAGIMASPTFSLSAGHPAHRRLYGLSWDEIALSSELGTEGYALPPDQKGFARSMTLMAARSAKVCAFDTPSLQRNKTLFQQECHDAAAAGYEGKFTLDPDQVEIINEIFS
jgi:Citrate lyase beta subunit